MRWLLRIGALLVLAALALAWLAPAWYAGPLLVERAQRLGVQLELGALRPAWPLGFQTESASLQTDRAALQFSALRAVWNPGAQPWSARAQLGTGLLQLRAPLHATSAQLFAHDVPLESLELYESGGIALRGRVTGVATWALQDEVRFSARVRGGDIRWLGGVLGARTEHVAVRGSLVPESRSARIEVLEATGPSFDLSGEGEVLPGGELALRIEVRRVEERLLRALRLLGIAPPERFPARYALVGPWQRARLELLP